MTFGEHRRFFRRRRGAWGFLALTVFVLLLPRHGGAPGFFAPFARAADAFAEGAEASPWALVLPFAGEWVLLLVLGAMLGHFFIAVRSGDGLPFDEAGADAWLGQLGGATLLLVGLFFAVTADRLPLHSHAFSLLALVLAGRLLLLGEPRRSGTWRSSSHDAIHDVDPGEGFMNGPHMDPDMLRFLRFLSGKLGRDGRDRRGRGPARGGAGGDEGRRARGAPRSAPGGDETRRPGAAASGEEPLEIGDPWPILGLEPGVDARTVRKAFHELSKRFHPDLAPPGMQREAEQAMKKLNLAYRKIMDEMKPAGLPED